MANLKDIVNFCNERVHLDSVSDFPGAENGLQIENSGNVNKIGAAVDAGQIPYEEAIKAGVDFLIVHHGMFWSPIRSISGKNYRKIKTAFDGNLAVYSSHLPLDAHQEIGNNKKLADALGLEVIDWFLQHEGTPIAALASFGGSTESLKEGLSKTFGNQFTAIEYGSREPSKIAILTGSGRSALSEMKSLGADTLITGELRQEHFNLAQEEGFNLYVCGHYATETFGVEALGKEVAEKFNLPFEFIKTPCPL